MKKKTILDLIKDLIHAYTNWAYYNSLVTKYHKTFPERKE